MYLRRRNTSIFKCGLIQTGSIKEKNQVCVYANGDSATSEEGDHVGGISYRPSSRE